MERVLAGRLEPATLVHDGEWSLAEPFSIGGLELDNRVVQAPLAGIANWAFRRQSRRHGAGLAVSEMIASFGVHYGNRKTLAMLRIAPDEHPVGVQLFGAEPDVMAEAARVVEDAGADLVDINMGCPVRKVCKTGAGAALLDDLARGERIVAAMARAVRIPVTVKMRRGATAASQAPIEAARRFEAAGAAALFVHPRAASEEYSGRADHAITAEVAAAVEIPVVASGDIATPGDAARVLEQVGCAAVAIGRGALGRPWTFGEVASGRAEPARSLAEAVAELLRFASDARLALGAERSCAYMRKFYPWYLAGHEVPAGEREELLTAPTLSEALVRLSALAGTGRSVETGVAVI